jgi:hypothetical protein
MNESDDIYTKYNIDKSKLKRDYIAFPLQHINDLPGKPFEAPEYDDLYYLYIDLNITRHELCRYFNISSATFKVFVKKLGIKKDPKMIHKNVVQGTIKNYGVENISQTNIWKEKVTKHNLEVYGCEWSVQAEEFKCKSRQTKYLKYGNETFTNPEKIAQTCLQKYGKRVYSQTEEYKTQYTETCRKKYGKDAYAGTELFREQRKKTMLEKYGVDNPLKYEPIRNKIKETIKQRYGVDHYSKCPRYKEQIKETTKHRYGVEYYTQTEEYKELWKNEQFRKRIYKKRIDTMKKQGTYGGWTSKEEQRCFKLLTQKFPDAVNQYYDKERYPFHCDFYIPTLDLFIEYQGGGGGHNGRPFKNTIEDKQELQELYENAKMKGDKSFYTKIIDTWTIRDPLKRETAKKNNLNWIEFFTEKEFQDWLKRQ